MQNKSLSFGVSLFLPANVPGRHATEIYITEASTVRR